MVSVERTAEIMALHEAILGVSATAWDGLDKDAYGNNSIRECFTPHISLAKVDCYNLSRATDIGRKAFGDWYTTRTRTLDLCDIGPRSERWHLLASFA